MPVGGTMTNQVMAEYVSGSQVPNRYNKSRGPDNKHPLQKRKKESQVHKS